MKKRNQLLAFALLSSVILQAQIIEGTPCISSCLDGNKSTISGRMPNQNGISSDKYLPCNAQTAGNLEDNPGWWHFRAIGSSATFSITTSNCKAGTCGTTDIQMTIWEGDNCQNVTPIKCITGSSGTLTVATSPCKIYYLQVDGVCESQCNIVITYDKEEILGQRNFQNTIEGEKQICKGISKQFSTKITTVPLCFIADYKWSLSPSTAGTITKNPNNPAEISLNITNAPTDNKVKLVAEPLFSKCAPNVIKAEIEINILDPNSAECKSLANNDASAIDNQVKVYPNPVEDKFNIEVIGAKTTTLNLYNTQGQLVLSQNEMKQISDNKYEAFVSELPKGIYLLKMNLDGKATVQKVIIE